MAGIAKFGTGLQPVACDGGGNRRQEGCAMCARRAHEEAVKKSSELEVKSSPKYPICFVESKQFNPLWRNYEAQCTWIYPG